MSNRKLDLEIAELKKSLATASDSEKNRAIVLIESYLGERDNYTPMNAHRDLLQMYALLYGVPEPTVNVWKFVELVNFYINPYDPNKNDIANAQKLSATILHQLVNAFHASHIDESVLQKIIKHEIDNRPPEKLEIITPNKPPKILQGVTHYQTKLVIQVASLNHPIMLVGPAGCGKTSIAESVATALDLPFYVTSAINDTHELTGFVDGFGKYHSTPFRKAFETGGVWIADEIDAWDAPALLAANSALANGFATFPDCNDPITRHADFRMIATANTYGSGADRVYVGRNELDGASLDRFAVIDVDYDLTLESSLARGNRQWLEYVWKFRKLVAEKKIRHIVSTRAIINGAMALETEMKHSDVEEIYLLKGMSESDRNKIDIRFNY